MAARLVSDIVIRMGLSISKTKNKGGRPRTDATPVMVRIQPGPLAALDGYIAEQPDPKPSRPEMIRTVLEGWLREKGYLPK